MTIALKQTPLSPSLSEPVHTFTFAGQFWNVRTMEGEEIKWLLTQFNENDPAYSKYIQACQAELDRRKPTPQKLGIITALEKNSATLLEKFTAVLAKDKLFLSDLSTGAGSKASTRYGEGLQLALDGRWELPACLGWGFKVDSLPGQYGCLKYEVKCRTSIYHNYNNCKCDDFLYHAAGKLGGWCHHVCCVYFVSEAQKLQ